MLPPVFRILMADADVQGYCAGRIYRAEAPEPGDRAPGPYIVWTMVSGIPENNLSDPPPFDRQTVQVDCYHADERDIGLFGDAVRDAMEPVVHMTQVIGPTRDLETRNFRLLMQFDFFNR